MNKKSHIVKFFVMCSKIAQSVKHTRWNHKKWGLPVYVFLYKNLSSYIVIVSLQLQSCFDTQHYTMTFWIFLLFQFSSSLIWTTSKAETCSDSGVVSYRSSWNGGASGDLSIEFLNSVDTWYAIISTYFRSKVSL